MYIFEQFFFLQNTLDLSLQANSDGGSVVVDAKLFQLCFDEQEKFVFGTVVCADSSPVVGVLGCGMGQIRNTEASEPVDTNQHAPKID
jgi:hypothetical protein